MSAIHNYDLTLAFLVACCAKITILLSCAWLIVFALRRRASAALRHHIWAVAILGILMLPVFAMLLPAWHSSTFGNAAVLWTSVRGTAASPAWRTAPSITIDVAPRSTFFDRFVFAALLVWICGFAIILVRLLSGLARLAWVSAHANPLFEDEWMCEVLNISQTYKISRSVRLVQCGSPLAMPLTWGILHPVIVLPVNAAGWTEGRRRVVLSHELAHIARHDWILQICAEFARALYWFHPLAWLAAARLRQEGERASDDAVLRSGIAPDTYASQLLELARTLKNNGRGWSTALAIARPTNLERRFAAMLNPSIDRRHLSLQSKFLIPLFALCLLLPLTALRAPAQNLSGKVSGSIHDPSGASVPNATIIMTNHAADTIDMTVSDRDGNFAFKGLPPGDYELQAQKPGFQSVRISGISLEAGGESTHAIVLQVGATTGRLDVVPDENAKPASVATTSGKIPRLRIGGSVEAAKIVTRVQPVYPESAKSAGVSGAVVLHAVIGTDGKPLALHVVNSQIDPDLARSAVEAITQWRYTPTLLNGEPVEVDTTITVNFSLQP